MKNSYLRLKWYQIFSVIIFLTVCGWLILNVIPIKSNINQYIEGIQWDKNDTENSENVTLKIEGKYVKYVFHFFHKHDYFEGKISASNCDIISKDSTAMQTILFEEDSRSNNLRGKMQYFVFSDVDLQGDVSQDLYSFGTLYQENGLSQGVIIRNDTEGAVAISYPSKSREDAVKLAQNLLPDEWLQ